MQKIYVLTAKDVSHIQTLMKRKCDNEYIVLKSNDGYSDICQWSDKYQNVHIATVRDDRLDESNRLDKSL